jgi:hypothetical protein
LALLLLVGATACIDPILGPAPDPADPVENFDILWREFDRYYSFFELKGVDWDSLRTEYRPMIRPGANNQVLFSVISGMLDELKDGHLNVFSDVGTYGYIDWYADRPVSFDHELIAEYLRGRLGSLAGGKLEFGEPATGIGYIRIQSFSDGLAADMDSALTALDSVRGLIVDVRHNGGGSDSEARKMAGRLVDARRLYRTVRVRNGPDHDDFTDPIPSYVEPEGAHRFDGPLVLLTNRRTFSAAESFVLAARTRAGPTTVVGDTTGGGSGFPMLRELPNGWTYRISRWIAYDVDGNTFEGVGLAPDEVITFEEFAPSDTILQRAVAILQQ